MTKFWKSWNERNVKKTLSLTLTRHSSFRLLTQWLEVRQRQIQVTVLRLCSAQERISLFSGGGSRGLYTQNGYNFLLTIPPPGIEPKRAFSTAGNGIYFVLNWDLVWPMPYGHWTICCSCAHRLKQISLLLMPRSFSCEIDICMVATMPLSSTFVNIIDTNFCRGL